MCNPIVFDQSDAFNTVAPPQVPGPLEGTVPEQELSSCEKIQFSSSFIYINQNLSHDKELIEPEHIQLEHVESRHADRTRTHRSRTYNPIFTGFLRSVLPRAPVCVL